MITKITVENFKSFKSSQSLDLKPINAVFGPNSAGKSSFVQALLYCRHTFRTGNFDAYTISNGANLGGFQNIINSHDLDKELGVSIEVISKDGFLSQKREYKTSIDLKVKSSQYGVLPTELTYSYMGERFVTLVTSRRDPRWLSIVNINIESEMIVSLYKEYYELAHNKLKLKNTTKTDEALKSLFELVLNDLALLEVATFFTSSYWMASERKELRRRRPRFPTPRPVWTKGDTKLNFRHAVSLHPVDMMSLILQYQQPIRDLVSSSWM